MRPVIHIKLLGAFAAKTADGEDVHINAKKSKALIAYLLMAPQMRHSREHLAALLWDSHDDAKARANLRQAVASLRRALDDKDAHYLLGNDADLVGLNPDLFRTDIDDLENGVSAASGELLPDLAGCSEPFEEWRRVEAARIAALAQTHLGASLDDAVAAGDPGDIILAAAQLLEADPLDESAYIAKFNAEVKAGAPRAAIATYQHYKRLLADETGEEPTPRFRDAADHVRRSLGVADIVGASPPEKAPHRRSSRGFPMRFAGAAAATVASAVLLTSIVALTGDGETETAASAPIYDQTHVRTRMEQEWMAAAYDNYPNLRRHMTQCKFDGDEDTQKIIWACSYLLQSLHASEPYRALVFAMRADAYRWEGGYQQAVKDYQAALELQPEHYNAIHGLAYAYYLSGRYDLAIERYEQVRELVPIHFMALYRMGETYFAKEDYERAAEVFSQAVRENPNSGHSYYHLALSHMRLGNVSEAKAHFKKAARLHTGVRTRAETFYAELSRAEEQGGETRASFEAAAP